MPDIIPPTRPNASREGVLAFITDGLPLPAFPFLVGRRGYYADTMGAIGMNDVNIYDDAIFLVEREGMVGLNANCDPSRITRGIARLCVGRWLYRPGIHNISKDPKTHPHYEALVQAGKVTVDRGAGVEETDFFGINIHCGGENTTSSLGCQTIPPGQWGTKFGAATDISRFMGLVHRALARENRDTPDQNKNYITYILTSRYPSP